MEIVQTIYWNVGNTCWVCVYWRYLGIIISLVGKFVQWINSKLNTIWANEWMASIEFEYENSIIMKSFMNNFYNLWINLVLFFFNGHRPRSNNGWDEWCAVNSEQWTAHILGRDLLRREYNCESMAFMQSSAQHKKFHIETNVPFDAIFFLVHFSSFICCCLILLLLSAAAAAWVYSYLYFNLILSFVFFFFCFNDLVLFSPFFPHMLLLFISIVHRSCITLLLFPLEFIQTMQARTWSD